MTTTITVIAQDSQSDDEDTYRVFDDGGEYDDSEEMSFEDAEGEAEERKRHYGSASVVWF